MKRPQKHDKKVTPRNTHRAPKEIYHTPKVRSTVVCKRLCVNVTIREFDYKPTGNKAFYERVLEKTTAFSNII